MKIKEINLNHVLIYILLLLLILILSFMAINLRHLALWADYQTICIKEESADKTIPWAVRKCNGRSKVYQVK